MLISILFISCQGRVIPVTCVNACQFWRDGKNSVVGRSRGKLFVPILSQVTLARYSKPGQAQLLHLHLSLLRLCYPSLYQVLHLRQIIAVAGSSCSCPRVDIVGLPLAMFAISYNNTILMTLFLGCGKLFASNPTSSQQEPHESLLLS